MTARPMTPARRLALDTGARFYIGPPCVAGHLAGRRYTSTGACVECVAKQDRTGRARRPLIAETVRQGVR